MLKLKTLDALYKIQGNAKISEMSYLRFAAPLENKGLVSEEINNLFPDVIHKHELAQYCQ
ncbi:MAG: hypothetical protein PG981_001353 [Wolbachia endosymbiont of Ctenocephalides orientis wCori]|nr:MAG: hypothetical protein PG981_001353 [Wolbachia endosymbiont of Ctenocephalides orientis wCori]